MSVALTFQAYSFREVLRRYWAAFSATVIGDIIATAIAIAGMSLLFLVCSYAVIWLTRMGAAIVHLFG